MGQYLSTVNRARLLRLLCILIQESDSKNPISLNDIISSLEKEGLDADRKSLYKDIDALNECLGDLNLKIVKEREGNNCRYHLEKRLFALESGEIKLLIDSIMTSVSVPAVKAEELRDKLLSMLSKEEKRSALLHNIAISKEYRTDNNRVFLNIDAISEAIAEDKQISFKYLEWNDKKKQVPRRNGHVYQVSPWALIQNESRYYLLAHLEDSQDGSQSSMRTYRVDKIDGVELVDKLRRGATAYKKHNMEVYSRKSFGMFAEGAPVKVTMVCPPGKLDQIIDRLGKKITITKIANNKYEIEAEVYLSEKFYHWIMAQKDVEITGPLDVVKDIKNEIKRLADQYGMSK